MAVGRVAGTKVGSDRRFKKTGGSGLFKRYCFASGRLRQLIFYTPSEPWDLFHANLASTQRISRSIESNRLVFSSSGNTSHV